jgi:hypothetical protein
MAPAIAPPSTVISTPSRSDQRNARSSSRCTSRSTAVATVIPQSTITKAPIVEKRAASSGVPTLKWLATPRYACAAITPHSTTTASAVSVAVQRTSRGRPFTRPSSQSSVKP